MRLPRPRRRKSTRMIPLPPRRILSGPPPRRSGPPPRRPSPDWDKVKEIYDQAQARLEGEEEAEASMPPLSRPEDTIDAQGNLFDVGEEWQHEWKGMPEYLYKDQEPFMTMQLHFASWEHVEEFAKLVGQKISGETRYIWYPKPELKKVAKFRYVDANPE
jgi:hypothetical protein